MARILTKKFAFAMMMCASLLLAACGSEPAAPVLTLTPDSFDITVDSATGMQTGATAVQASLDQKPLDLSMILWSAQPEGVPIGCIGVDQAGVPHCNLGCGSSFKGTIKATVNSTGISGSGQTATATVNCTVK